MNYLVIVIAALLFLVIFYLTMSDESCKSMMVYVLAILLGVRIFWMWIDFYIKYNGL